MESKLYRVAGHWRVERPRRGVRVRLQSPGRSSWLRRQCWIADALGDIIDSVRSNSSSFLFTSVRAVLNAHVSLLFTVHCLLSDVPHPPHPPSPIFFTRSPLLFIS